MPPQTISPQTPALESEVPIFNLYRQVLEAWNRQDAHAFAALFSEDSNVIGFDGSQMNGRAEIELTLSGIFTHHKTAAYVAKVREVRFITPQVALLRAVVGMIPPGGADLNPAVNSIQSLLAVLQNNQWFITLFQNTPAQFHGRPELAEALTTELRQLLA